MRGEGLKPAFISKSIRFISFFIILSISWPSCHSFLEPGKWTFNVSQKSCHLFQVHKALVEDSTISIRILCDPTVKESSFLSGSSSNDLNVTIGWVVRQSPCYEEYLEPEVLVSGFCLY